LIKTFSRVLRTWGDGSPSYRTTTLSTQPRQRRSGFRTSLKVLEWSSQSTDLKPIKHLWRDLKIAVQRRSPSNPTELERICREEWEKLPKYRCAKLVASYPRRIEARNCCQRCFKKVLSKRSQYLCKCDRFFTYNKFAKMSAIMGYCV
jgi:hypothetical protein